MDPVAGVCPRYGGRQGEISRQPARHPPHPRRRRLRGLVHQLARGEDDLLPDRVFRRAHRADGGGVSVRLPDPEPARRRRVAGHRPRESRADGAHDGDDGDDKTHRRPGCLLAALTEQDRQSSRAGGAVDGERRGARFRTAMGGGGWREGAARAVRAAAGGFGGGDASIPRRVRGDATEGGGPGGGPEGTGGAGDV